MVKYNKKKNNCMLCRTSLRHCIYLSSQLHNCDLTNNLLYHYQISIFVIFSCLNSVAVPQLTFFDLPHQKQNKQ